MSEKKTRLLDLDTLSPSRVARLLSDIDERTIRSHCVSVPEWKRLGGYESNKIPSARLGNRYLIPRWWAEKMLDLLGQPPEALDSLMGGEA